MPSPEAVEVAGQLNNSIDDHDAGLYAAGLFLAKAGLALVVGGGSAYDDVPGRLWAFAVLGTLLACLMMAVHGLVARHGRSSVYLTWVALATIVGLGLTVSHRCPHPHGSRHAGRELASSCAPR